MRHVGLIRLLSGSLALWEPTVANFSLIGIVDGGMIRLLNAAPNWNS
jgi:hypothetical protein